MRRGSRPWPSLGCWLVVTSWAAALLFVGLAYRTPRLDRLALELAHIEQRQIVTASDAVVAELGRVIDSHPALASDLAGETGARILESRRDGFASGERFHLVLAASAPAELIVEGPPRTKLRLRYRDEQLELAIDRGRANLTLPKRWRGSAALVSGERTGVPGELRISGATPEAAR